MVTVVSEEKIKGERAGRPGYTKKVEVKSIPMFRGKAKPKFGSFYMNVRPAIGWSRAMEVSEGKKLTINHVKVNIPCNMLISVSVYRGWRERGGFWYGKRSFKKTGYGGVELHDLGLSVKGIFKERITPVGVMDVTGAWIEVWVRVYNNRTITSYVRMWGNEKPLK